MIHILAKSINVGTPSQLQHIPWWTVAAAAIVGIAALFFWKTTIGKLAIIGSIAFIAGVTYAKGGFHH